MSTPYSGWGKPALGYTALRQAAITSPNFNLATPAASPTPSWGILQSGVAYFFGLILSGGTITGPDYIINSTGAFFYTGTPAVGNLAISIVPGTVNVSDPEGNTARPGITTYGTSGNASFIQLLTGNPAIVNVATGDAIEATPGRVTTSVSGSGGSKILTSYFKAPVVTGQPGTTSAFLQLTSPSADLTTVPVSLDLVAATAASSNALQMNPGYGAFVTPELRIASNGPGGTGEMVFIPPSGDTTGATDVALINFALANTFGVQLLPGVYYVNAPIQLPNGAAVFGFGRPPVTQNFGTIIRAVGAINSVMASQSWVLNSAGGNTGCNIRDLKIDGNGTAVTCLTLTTFDALCQNVNFANPTFVGVELDANTANGSVGITTDHPNNRFIDCTFENCGQNGIQANDRGNVVFTDAFVIDCIFATMTGTTAASAAIALDHSAGWLIDGCHFYGLNAHGLKLGVPSITRVVNCYFEAWGQGASANIWRAIDFKSVPVFGGVGSIVANNTFWLHTAPGNAGSTIEAVHYFTPAASTNPWVTTGNVFQCDPVAGFAAANAVIYENAGATSVTRYGTGGNEANGGWTNTQVLIPAGGTITNTGF